MLRRLIPRAQRSIRKASTTASVPGVVEEAPVQPSNASDSTSAAQSPNYPSTWSTSQRPRPAGASSARFEQTASQLQPNPLSAMEMINNTPIRVIKGRNAVCDGGIGPLGHPKIFINLDKPGPHPCGYCGIRFEQAPHHGHDH